MMVPSDYRSGKIFSKNLYDANQASHLFWCQAFDFVQEIFQLLHFVAGILLGVVLLSIQSFLVVPS